MGKDNFLSTDVGQRVILGVCITIFLVIILLFFGKIHCLIFILLLIISYKLTDYYVTSLNKPSKSSKCWPNLLIFFEPTKDLQKELIQKQSASTRYIHKNPWIHLMLSKRIDTAIDEASSIFHN
ncbi:unnamed protein product [Adineta steineri]|uniref:Uncharacterized protein n=1 Tax=Adineta steineri TaxID=433720 RepID=A0A814VXW1_9BILA|nr:unnamed protein product [Adineta steineri]